MFRLGYSGSTIVPLKSPGVFKRFIKSSWSFQNSSRKDHLVTKNGTLHQCLDNWKEDDSWCCLCCMSDVLSSVFVFDKLNSEIHS